MATSKALNCWCCKNITQTDTSYAHVCLYWPPSHSEVILRDFICFGRSWWNVAYGHTHTNIEFGARATQGL